MLYFRIFGRGNKLS